MDTMQQERAAGAVLGLAVGDALGTTYEFERIAQPAYPALATGPATDVVGGGPFGLQPGQITDDSQMAACLATSLAARGHLDVDDVARRYVAWKAHAFDIGTQTSHALGLVARGTPPLEAGLVAWRESGHDAAANGSLMRTTPIAVWAAASGPDADVAIGRAIEAAVLDSLITHADPRCALACAAFDAALVAALRAPGAIDGRAMIEAARRGVREGGELLRARYAGVPDEATRVPRALEELGADLDAALAPEPAGAGDPIRLHAMSGFVRVAFRLAFWHAVHTPSWRDAVVDVASRGGDADTNAAIVGALLGARDGAPAIPPAWAERVIAATQRGPRAWAETHHPRHLLALARAPE